MPVPGARDAAEDLLAFVGSPARPAPVTRALSALARPNVLVGVSVNGARLLRTVGADGLTGERVFEVASLTKAFTAALLMRLAREGRIQLDVPLARHFTAFQGLPARVTPLALATHTAGLPGHPLRTYLSALTHHYDPYGALTAGQAIASARRWASITPPGFRYSNLGYGLLGLALEAAGGLDLPGAVRHALTVPLGLHDTRFDLTPDLRARLAAPHLLGRAVPTTNFGSLRGAGGLHSSADDLLTWLEAQLAARPDTDLGAALLDAQAERLRLRPATPVAQGVAAGWLCVRVHGRPWRWHGGTARGTRAAVAFTPGGPLALVALADSGPVGGAAPPEALLFALMQAAGRLSRRR